MAWENPVTTWGQAGKTVPGAGDFNRIEGNIQHLQDTGAVQAELDAHLADYTTQIPFATTAGSANAYTVSTDPALPSLVAGVAITVKFHVQNTGASTLNWNSKGAKPIKKANGSNVASGNLKANGVYTLRYDGVNFILQGSDAAGNAIPADVLSGKTFSSDVDTELVGTMPNRGGVVIAPGESDVAIPAGYHDGEGYVLGDPNLVSSNILKGKSIFDVSGAVGRIATGTVYVPEAGTDYTITIGFRPAVVVVFEYGFNRHGVGFYRANTLQSWVYRPNPDYVTVKNPTDIDITINVPGSKTNIRVDYYAAEVL